MSEQPLTSVMGFAELLQQWTCRNSRGYLDVISRAPNAAEDCAKPVEFRAASAPERKVLCVNESGIGSGDFAVPDAHEQYRGGRGSTGLPLTDIDPQMQTVF